MIAKDKLKNYASKLMFDMNDVEYETLQKEFDVILKYMDLISNIDNISEVKPMTFPYELNDVQLRNDEESRSIEIEQALSNAKSKKGREISVPKVVE